MLRTLLGVLLTFVSAAHAADKSWQGQSPPNWSGFLNWSPLGPPIASDDVFVGDLTQFGVDYETALDQDFEIASLEITNGADVDTNGQTLDVNGQVEVTGLSSTGITDTRLIVREHASGPGTTSLLADRLIVEDGGRLILDGGRTLVEVDSGSQLTVGASASARGYGVVRFQGVDGDVNAIRLDNAGEFGTLRPVGAPASTRYDLRIEASTPEQTTAALWGLTGDSPVVTVDSMTTLDIDTEFLSDMRNRLDLFAGAIFDTSDSPNDDNELIVESGGRIVVDAASTGVGVDGAAIVRGPSLELESLARIEVDSGELILEEGLTTATGSTIDVAAGAVLRLAGGASISGDLNLNGSGSSLVVDSGVTVLDPVFDFDGASENAVTTVNDGGSLSILSTQITAGGSDVAYNGTINVFGGSFRVSSALSGGWVMEGVMNLRDAFLGVGAPFEVTGQMNVSQGTSRVSTQPTFAAGSLTEIVATTDNLELLRAATIEAGAKFAGDGVLRLDDEDAFLTLADGAEVAVAVANVVGTLRVVSNGVGSAEVKTYDQLGGGILEIEFGGAASTAYDRLVVGDTANLGGGLLVESLAGYQATLGDEFTILEASLLNGRFDTTSVSVPIPSGLAWRTEYTGTSVVLSVVLPGDYNEDAVVDASDYLVWRETFGDLNDLRADGDGDGVIDQDDYDLWVANLGAQFSASVAVPAPGGAALLALGVLLSASRGRGAR